MFADIAGKNWIKQFHKKAAASREKMNKVIGKNETFGIYQITDKDFWVFGDNRGLSGQAIYHALHLKAPKIIQDSVINGPNYKKISLEMLPKYAADRMFWTTFASSDSKKTENNMKSRVIWKNLKAVKNKHVYNLGYNNMRFYDPISIEGQMDLVVMSFYQANNL